MKLYLSILLSGDIIYFSSAKDGIRMANDRRELTDLEWKPSRWVPGNEKACSNWDSSLRYLAQGTSWPFASTCPDDDGTGCFLSDKPHHEFKQSGGYCTPWGGGGGDLCRGVQPQPKGYQQCNDVDADFYHKNCNRSCMDEKCASFGHRGDTGGTEDLCKGYTWDKTQNRGKLKSTIGGLTNDSRYECNMKITLIHEIDHNSIDSYHATYLQGYSCV